MASHRPNLPDALNLPKLNASERDLGRDYRAAIEHLTPPSEAGKRWRTGAPPVAFGTPKQTASDIAGGANRPGNDIFREAREKAKTTIKSIREVLLHKPEVKHYIQYKNSEFMDIYLEYKKLDEQAIEYYDRYWYFYKHGDSRAGYHHRGVSYAHVTKSKIEDAKDGREDIRRTFPGYDELYSMEDHKDRIDKLKCLEADMQAQKDWHLSFVRRGF